MLLISVSITAQFVRAIKTNVCVLVFRTMGATANLIGSNAWSFPWFPDFVK